MAEIKRKFYNVGDKKGFTKAVFYQYVLSLASGEELDDDVCALVAEAAQYELDGIAARPRMTAVEKKDPLQSDYANALRAAILPLLSNTPRTAKELVEAASAQGHKAPSNKDFSGPWVSRVLNAEPGVVCVKKVVEKVDNKGLKSQVECNAYKRV